MAFERKYSDEVRIRSVKEVLRRRQHEPRNRAIVREVAAEFDVGPQSLRQWLIRYDDGSYDYDSTQPAAGARGGSRYRQTSRADLVERVLDLEAEVQRLAEDNVSLKRVVSLLSEDLRGASTRGA